MPASYLMENDEEIERLEWKTEIEAVRRQATRAGLAPGMRVADVCCGSGKTTSILGDLVGPTGTAIGIDGSRPRLDYARAHYARPGIDFVHRDVKESLADLGPVDFVWVRFALEYFRGEAFALAANFAGLLRPEGIMCLVDLDNNSLGHHGMSDRLERAYVGAVKQLEQAANFDLNAGRKLYSHLYRLGFHDLGVAVEAHHLIYGELKSVDAFNWIKKVEVVGRRVDLKIEGYDSLDEFADDFRAYFSDPARFAYTPLIACWGRKAPD